MFGGQNQPTPAPGYMTRVYNPYHSMTQAMSLAMPPAPRIRAQEIRPRNSLGTVSSDSGISDSEG